MDDENRENLEEGFRPPLPNLSMAVELKEALIEEDAARVRILDPRRTVGDLPPAARELACARERVSAALAGVGAEAGVLALPILRDERPRLVGNE